MSDTDSPLFHSAYLTDVTQNELITEVQAVIRQAPLFQPVMPRSGRPFTVKMTNCGPLGWVADRYGYRYQSAHPATGCPWPAIPGLLMEIWEDAGGYASPPEACLVNHYAKDSKMGLHQDRDEQDFAAPVVSISLGDKALFRYGGKERKGPTRSAWLSSGDVVVLEGKSRLAFHGIDRILSGTSGLVPGGGRINLTLRRVT